MTNLSKQPGLRAAAFVVAIGLGTGGQAAADVVFPDDVIIQGSACVGLDCVNNESFGADTIILKENNTRILFNDTSTTAGFPKNDWRLTANGQFSGEASFFSIDDVTGSKVPFKITAGAPSNALFVDSVGNVGLGTATPGLELHINSSDTPAQRLEQNAGGGFAAQTWDVGGNEANFFVRDVTGGSRLPLRLRPGAPPSSLDIAKDGNVSVGASLGVGVPSPAFNVDVLGSGHTTVRLTATAAGSVPRLLLVTPTREWRIGNDPTGNQLVFFDANAGSVRAAFDTSGNVGIGTTTPAARMDVSGTIRAGTLNANPAANTVCFSASNILGTCSSDLRLKRDVEYLHADAGLAAVMQLKPAAFRWQDGDDRLMAGFVAQDTQLAIPAAVHQPAGGEFLSLDSTAVLAYAVKAIQELKADNDVLRAEIERLKTAR
jgi:hypothetical protein